MATVNPRLGIVEYFKKNLLKGYTEESLRIALINQGYSRMAVDKALEQTHKELAKKAPVLKEKPFIKYEVFNEKDQPIKIKKSWWRKIFRRSR